MHQSIWSPTTEKNVFENLLTDGTSNRSSCKIRSHYFYQCETSAKQVSWHIAPGKDRGEYTRKLIFHLYKCTLLGSAAVIAPECTYSIRYWWKWFIPEEAIWDAHSICNRLAWDVLALRSHRQQYSYRKQKCTTQWIEIHSGQRKDKVSAHHSSIQVLTAAGGMQQNPTWLYSFPKPKEQ